MGAVIPHDSAIVYCSLMIYPDRHSERRACIDTYTAYAHIIIHPVKIYRLAYFAGCEGGVVNQSAVVAEARRVESVAVKLPVGD